MVTTEEGGKASAFLNQSDFICSIYLKEEEIRGATYTSNLSDKVTLSRQNLSE